MEQPHQLAPQITTQGSSPAAVYWGWASVPQVCSDLPENWEKTGEVIAALPLRHYYFTAQSPGMASD